MAEIKQLFSINTLPGIKRDGTELDGDTFNDGQWVRFQRGRPKKMGGYQLISDRLAGPIRKMTVWSRYDMNSIYSFSPSKIEMVLVDGNGLGSSIVDRTPAGFTANPNYIWSVDTQYDDAVGSQGTVVLAHAADSLVNIDDPTGSKPYLGLATGSSAFTSITDAPSVSGGIFTVPPYTVVHGSDGFIAWSDANQPQVWYTSAGNIGDAGADRVTGAKIVKGLALRSGSGPAALLWSLDSVIRMDYTGGGAIFKFSHLSTQISVLSQNSIIEYDGMYFWIGIDRFLVCDGSRTYEVPNEMNVNWFFDNINFAHRQKVWAMKIPRYGEIWWFYPRGENTECSHAVIYNVNQKIWYDVELGRSAGFYSQVLHYPVMAGTVPSPTWMTLTLTTISGTISVGDTVRGTSYGAIGIVSGIIGSEYQITLQHGSFLASEGILDINTSATATISAVTNLYKSFLHEKGTDAVEGEFVTSIPSFFETSDFGFPTGGSQPNQPTGINRWTRLIRVEPDFVQSGEMTMTVTGKEFANAPETVSSGYNFTSETEKIDMREQRREIRLKFTSDVVGGDYQMGKVLMHLEPGDVRN